jgi:hypothetical protein
MDQSTPVSDLLKEIERLNNEITELKLRVPKGILQVCASCKSIRAPDGQWIPLDRYLALYTDIDCSHGYCERCADRMLAEVDDPLPYGLENHGALK